VTLMRLTPDIPLILLAAILGGTGCSTPGPLKQIPITQDAMDAFLKSGRDARNYGITIYHDVAGDRFEFANRLHQDRSAEMDFISPRSLDFPVIKARTATFVDFNLLLDSSSLQNWLRMGSVEAMDYRTFAPPTGEYPDHVISEVPGYAGVANKVIMDTLHIESPIFFVPPAVGSLGPLARIAEGPEEAWTEKEQKTRWKLGARIHAVMGAAAMGKFAYIRFNFEGRGIRFSTHSTYSPIAASGIQAQLPMLLWRGRPVVEGTLNGKPIQLLIDTAGDFEISLSGELEDSIGSLVLGNLEFDEVQLSSHAGLGLPEAFPARIGLRLLSQRLLTLDYKQHRVWIEDLVAPEEEKVTLDGGKEGSAPVLEYRGIRR